MEDRKREEILIEEDEIDLYELWQRIWNRRTFIATLFLLITGGTALISFLMTPIYRSEAMIMPVSKQPSSGMAQLASQFLGVPIGESDLSSKVMAVLKSRTIRERVVDKLKLHEKILEEKPEKRDPKVVATEKLEDMVSISSDKKTGAITIGVEYKDPKLAKAIGDAYIEELQKILSEKSLTISKVNRMSIERQVKQAEEELKRALEELASFQKKEKVFVPEEQLKGTLDLYASLLSQKITLQTELSRLQAVLSPSSPQILSLKEQLKAIEDQLSKIEKSAGISAIPGLEEVPEKMSEYTQIFLKVKGLQAKYETLLKLYEQAKFEEQKENIYVEVIDPPSLPDIPVKPKKRLMVAVAGVSSLFLGIFLALFLDWVKEAKRRHSLKEGSLEREIETVQSAKE